MSSTKTSFDPACARCADLKQILKKKDELIEAMLRDSQLGSHKLDELESKIDEIFALCDKATDVCISEDGEEYDGVDRVALRRILRK